MLLYLGNGDSDKEKRNDKPIKNPGLYVQEKKKKVLQRKNHYHKMDKDERWQDDLSKN